MVKRGLLLLFVVAAALLFLLAGSVGVSATNSGDPCWSITSDGSGCFYGTAKCSWWDPGCWFSTCTGSTETCTYSVGTTYESSGDGYTVVCDNGGCNYVLTKDCNIQDGCANNLYDDYNYDGSICAKTTSCQDQCCPTGQTCQGTPATCQLTPRCEDKDSDTYQVPKSGFSASDCTTTIDCNDADANVYPGSCNSAAVTWSGSCSTSGTGGCGSGTCTRPLPSGCGDVCGDGSRTGSEGCG